MKFLWKRGLEFVKGRTVGIRRVPATLGEILELRGKKHWRARTIAFDGDLTLAEVFEDPEGISEEVWVRRTSRLPSLRVSWDLLGRVLDPLGEEAPPGEPRPLRWDPIPPPKRRVPSEPLWTGFSALDLFATLVKGQKLPVFLSPGLDVFTFLAHLISNVIQNSGRRAVVVFGGMGMGSTEEEEFLGILEERGFGEEVVTVLHRRGDPPAMITYLPRTVLTAAEFFREKGRDVLVVLGDLLLFAEELRALAAEREELQVRGGYPAYLFSEMARMMERAGSLESGSLTLLPFLTMPDDDISHPVPDILGYIGEGQLLFTKRMADEGISPPFEPLSSLSRLMPNAVSRNHLLLSQALYRAYARAKRLSSLEETLGIEVNEEERRLKEEVEERLISQEPDENRSPRRTLSIARSILKGNRQP